jgi:hypothetical protein
VRQVDAKKVGEMPEVRLEQHPYITLAAKYGIQSEKELSEALELYTQARKIVKK